MLLFVGAVQVIVRKENARDVEVREAEVREAALAQALDSMAAGNWMVEVSAASSSDVLGNAVGRLLIKASWEKPLELIRRKWQLSEEVNDRLVVPVEDIHTRLGFSERLAYPRESKRKPLKDWKMEVDDAPIFRYLYRNFRPRRHLEFGTWQGMGVLYVLEECEASVWTINLPFGESGSQENRPVYSYYADETEEITRWADKVGIDWKRENFRSDGLGFIGRFYLEKGLGNRVCQIYCDSSDWDTRGYPAGFFDSVLLDAGHSMKAVTDDTRKALSLVRSGGLVLWHDFCPDTETLLNCASPRGVIQAIEENWDWIKAQMQDIFWIKPSWILVGIKR